MQNRPWLLQWLNTKVKNYYHAKETHDGDGNEAAGQAASSLSIA